MEAAEESLYMENQTHFTWNDEYKAREQAKLETQRELRWGDLKGIAGLWGGDLQMREPSPRCIDLRRMCEEASEQNIVIYNCMHGYWGETGDINELLEEYKLSYNGSNDESQAYVVNRDRVSEEMQLQLFQWNVWSVPATDLPFEVIVSSADDEKASEDLFAMLCNRLSTDGELILGIYYSLVWANNSDCILRS